MADYDVAIIGASIAGCTAATLFGRQGLRVSLIDREPDPGHYKKVCTHFIQPSATPTIERLGLVDAIEAAGGVRNGAEVWTRWGWIRGASAKGPSHGYNITRERLDPMVRSLAAGTAGVDLLLGVTARELIRSGDRVSGVRVETQGRMEEIAARLVVGADGRNSRIAQLAKIPAKVRPHNRFAYFAYFRNLRLSTGSQSQMWLLEPDVAYMFPNEDGLTVAALMPAKDQLPAFKANLEDNFYQFFEGLPNGPDLRSAERASDFLGMLDMPNTQRQASIPGLALIGDAALASDPLWGVGCGWAFQSAEWLADETAEGLGAGAGLDRGLQRYAKRHKAALSGHHWLISDFARARAYSPIEKLVFSAATRDAKTAAHFWDFGTRSIGPREFLSPVALGRAAWVNLRHRGAKITPPRAFEPIATPAQA